VGFPIMIVAYAIVLFSSMDRSLILFHLDESAMGEFAFAFAAIPLVGLVPGLIGQIYYPRMTEAYATFGMNSNLLKTCIQASLLSGAFAGTAAFALYAVLPLLIVNFFPKYQPGIPALNVVLLYSFLLSFGMGPNYLLIAAARKRRQFLVLLVSAATMGGVSFLLESAGLLGIAWSVLIGICVYVIAMWAVVLLSVYRKAQPEEDAEGLNRPISDDPLNTEFGSP
jgi:O-antigen/teichoic acid export membrane protein